MWVSVESALIHHAVENILFAQQMNELELALSGFAGIGLLSKSTVFSILDKHLSLAFAALQSCSVAIGTVVEFMTFSDGDPLSITTKSIQFILASVSIRKIPTLGVAC